MASTGSNSGVEAPPARDAAMARADIVIGLTSHNDVRTVGTVVSALQQGLARYFGSSEARIVLADARSTDGTLDVARAAASVPLVEVDAPVPAALATVPYHGYPGRPGALRAILLTAQRLGATGCAVLDAAVETVQPEWIEQLIAPVLNDGFEYVSPYFARRVNEGAITKGIVYPTIRALYGVRLRQPAAAEFGCSARLLAHFLDQDFWDAEQAEVGIDLWLAVAAACGEFRMCETSLGTRATSRVTPSDLSTTLAQAVGALFADIGHRVDVWQRTRKSVPIPIVGTVPEIDAAPVHAEGLIESFRLGYRELREIWTWVLPPRTIVELRRLADAPPDLFRFDDRLWADIIYDFALGYGLRVMPHDHLLRSLTPLYTGWLASFVVQMNGASLADIEQRVEGICLAFEAERRHLIARWRWPERLR